MKIVRTLILGLFALCLLIPQNAEAKKYVLRIATVAPKGSMWIKVFNAMRWEVRKKSKKKLILKLYSGGRMGSEKGVVRKVRLDNLQGTSITAIGFTQVAPSLLALQLPFTFRNYKELDFVREHLDSYIRAKLRKKGFVLLGWGDVGYVYLYSKLKLRNVDDLKKAKIWAWTDDPLTQSFAKFGGLSPQLLELLHVRQGLQTGTIDTVAGTPLALIAMQWHSYIKYYIKYRFAIGIGATIVSKKSFDRLPPHLQKVLLEVSAKYHKILIKLIRRDNRQALKTLHKRGIKGIKLNRKQKKLVRKISRQIRKHLTGKLYSQEDIKRIRAAIKLYRKKRRR